MSKCDYGIYGYGNTAKVFADFPWLWAITSEEPHIVPDYVQVHNASLTDGDFIRHCLEWWHNKDHWGWPNQRQAWVFIQENGSNKVVKLKYKDGLNKPYKHPVEAILGVYREFSAKTLYLAFAFRRGGNEPNPEGIVIYRPPRDKKSFEEFFKDPEVAMTIL